MDPHLRANPLGQQDATSVAALSRRESRFRSKENFGIHLIRGSQHSHATATMLPAESPEGRRFLEHVTDAFIEAWGETFEKALAQAAASLFETMIDVQAVRPVVTLSIEASGHDELELIYNWLEQLLLRFEIDGLVLGEFQVREVVREENAVTLTAVVKGEKYEPHRHGGRVEVKGITYHQMSVERVHQRIIIRFLLDL